jgi:hypothetical protein
MKKSFFIEIVSAEEIWNKAMSVDSYSHTCKNNGMKRVYYHDISEHSLYKKLISAFGTFGVIPKIN